MKLWQKGQPLHKEIERYTVGKDYQLDQELIKYDVRVSMAHARMLAKIGILTQKERDNILAVLPNIEKNGLAVKPEDEDCHTAVENYLIDKLGDTGKKIHTARSRNDQVLTTLRLYYKAQLQIIEEQLLELHQTLKGFIARYGDIKLPGYTHTRPAMPSSIQLWGQALLDSIQDNRQQLGAVRKLIDQSPLGSGAGYGIPIEIDRQLTAKELGFTRVQENGIYAQFSRGKFEGMILALLNFIMFDVNKYASELIIFSMPVLGYFELPEEFTTGSSIMPHKKNPDVLEIMRANYHAILSAEMHIKSLSANLSCGYHRDFQLQKEPLLRSFAITSDSLQILMLIFGKLKVNPERCATGMTKELYATEKVYELVKQGVPFREAYRQVAEEFE